MTISLVADLAALTEGDDWLDQLVPYLEGNRDLTERLIRDHVPYVRYRRAQATYPARIDVSALLERIGAAPRPVPRPRSAGSKRTPASCSPPARLRHRRGHPHADEHRDRPTLEKALENLAEAAARL